MSARTPRDRHRRRARNRSSHCPRARRTWSRPFVDGPKVAAYCAAKHGLVGLKRSLALEYAKSGVTINAVCPGYTESEMFDRAVQELVRSMGKSPEEARAMLTRPNPQARIVKPEEVADAVAWLCSPSASAITGQAIAVAGGEVM